MIAVEGATRIDVFDVMGRHVRTLLGRYQPGANAVVWDGRDGAGSEMPSGVYFVRLRTAGEVITRRAVLLK